MAKQESSILAVDIGGGCLKMAEFSVSPDGAITLEQFAFRDMPDREMEPLVAFAGAYNALLSENRFHAKSVSLTISGSASFSRLSKLPQLSGSSSSIAKVIEFEAGTVVPYDMSEVCWGYQLLKHTVRVEREVETVLGEDQSKPKIEYDEADEFEALFVAVKTEQITGYTDVIVNSGKQIRSVDIAPVAMSNVAKIGPCQDPASTLLLNIGARCTSLVITEGERIFVRNIPIAGDTVTLHISKEFGISFQEAEELKLRHGFVALGGAYDEPESEVAATISKIARNVMTRLHGEINRPFSVWRSAHGGSAPKRMLLAGGGSLMQYTQEFFQEKLHIDVSYLNAFTGMNIADSIDRQKLLDVAPMFSELAGMSLRQVGVCPVDISLVPESIKFRQEFVQKRPYFYISAALIVFCLTSFLAAVYFRTDVSRRMVAQTQVEVDKTLQMQGKIKKLNNELNGVKGEYEEALAFLRTRSKWTDMLAELQSMIPNTMFLVAIEGQGTETAPSESPAGANAVPGGLFTPASDPKPMPGEDGSASRENYTIRKNAELITEVKELRLRFYTLTLPHEDLVEDLFRHRLKNSKFFEPEGKILSYERGDEKDNLKSFTMLLTLKEPIKK